MVNSPWGVQVFLHTLVNAQPNPYRPCRPPGSRGGRSARATRASPRRAHIRAPSTNTSSRQRVAPRVAPAQKAQAAPLPSRASCPKSIAARTRKNQAAAAASAPSASRATYASDLRRSGVRCLSALRRPPFTVPRSVTPTATSVIVSDRRPAVARNPPTRGPARLLPNRGVRVELALPARGGRLPNVESST